jgi:enoyl-CoA hydratase/carnithine racemase
MGYNTLLVEKKDLVALVTLNRPEKLNAVNLQMRSEFLQLLGELEVDDQVRVVVVTGAGRAFCAGADISEFGAREGDWRRQMTRELGVVKRIYEFEKPIIGAINGVSAGDGSQWLLAFDLNIASEKARLAWPATRLGIL